MASLYQIQFPNGKSYIGVTNKTVSARFGTHVYNTLSGAADRAINRALKKYTEGVRCVELVRGAWAYVLALEPKAIAAFQTFGRGGYNMTAGGEGAIGYKHTPVGQERMSANRKPGARHTAPHTGEAKAKMAAARMGEKLPAEHVENIRKALLGNQYNLGAKQTPEHLQNRVIGQLKAAKGVAWCARTQKWRAHISIGGHMRDLGRYTTESEALAVRARAVDNAIRGIKCPT
jgi:predicted GIY-YIG superfamily endonuclease